MQVKDSGVWTDFPGGSRTSCLSEAASPKKLRHIRRTGHVSVLLSSPISDKGGNTDLLLARSSDANEETSVNPGAVITDDVLL